MTPKNEILRLTSRANSVYQKEGIVELLRESGGYAVRKLSYLPLVHNILFIVSSYRLRNYMVRESGKEDILDTTQDYQGNGPYKSIEMMQIREEFLQLLDLVKQQNPQVIMEIGTANGGTLYCWCRYIESATKILSLDLPGGRFGGGYSKHKTKLFERFAPDKDLVFVRSDSHDAETKDRINRELSGKEIDFLFIDGDHTYEGVKEDFEMYKEFVSEGGIIAFHDIVYHPHLEDCEVDKFWKEIRDEYQTKEIIASSGQKWAGIGVIFV